MMNRKEFLGTCFKAGLCCCGAAMGLGKSLLGAQEKAPAGQDLTADLEKRIVEGAATPDWRKVEKSGYWIKDLMDNMDAMLDKETKVRLLQANGRSCYNRAFGAASEVKPTPEQVQRAIAPLKADGRLKQEGENTIITYSWGKKHQNPWGLIMQDGYCMCPVVESGPEGLSPTYCQCSTGYVGETFARILGVPVKATLVESLKTGGKDCIFRIEVPGKL